MLSHFWFKVSALLGLFLASMWPAAMSLVSTGRYNYFNIDESRISAALTDHVKLNRYPEMLTIPGVPVEGALSVQYTINQALQQEAERLLQKHNPDYGIVVAINPDTGKILTMAQSTRDDLDHGNLALANSYPAASISKLVTAVAAIDRRIASSQTVLAYNGKATSLYKKHVFNHKNNKWTRKLTLKESFAKSVNTVFGRLGAVDIGGESLRDYFYRLGFNARFASDIMFDNGMLEMATDDQWEIAESASGYTNRNTLSPLHGAVLAATAINGGKLIAPILVDTITGPNGIPLYRQNTPAVSQAMRAETAAELKVLMQETVRIGSARKSFRGFHRRHRENVRVGGKTGSLTGFKPRGRYDWFVGFAEDGPRKIAYAVLCINKEKWYVKSHRLARELLEFFFQPEPSSTQST